MSERALQPVRKKKFKIETGKSKYIVKNYKKTKIKLQFLKLAKQDYF